MRDRPPSSWRRVDGVGLIIRLWAGSAATFDLCTGRDEHQGAGASHREERLPAAAGRATVDGGIGLLAGHFKLAGLESLFDISVLRSLRELWISGRLECYEEVLRRV